MVQQAGLAPMKVCIFSSETEQSERLALDAEEAGYGVEQKFNEPQKLMDFISRSNVDHIVLIDVRGGNDEHFKLINSLCADKPLAMIALASDGDYKVGARAVDAGAQALVMNPGNAAALNAAFIVASRQQARQALLRGQINQLKEKLAERKFIEKAKGILMDSARVSEGEAFRLIQKQSQDKRQSMAEIARSIISATELVREAARGRGE